MQELLSARLSLLDTVCLPLPVCLSGSARDTRQAKAKQQQTRRANGARRGTGNGRKGEPRTVGEERHGSGAALPRLGPDGARKKACRVDRRRRPPTMATRRQHNRKTQTGTMEAGRRHGASPPPPPGRINNPLETPLRQAYGPCDEYSVSGASGGTVSGCRRAMVQVAAAQQQPAGFLRARSRNYKYTPPCFRCRRSRQAADR